MLMIIIRIQLPPDGLGGVLTRSRGVRQAGV